jgi:ABC-type nitrate/sulfonate/bicarbonate transport system ATPase subunit
VPAELQSRQQSPGEPAPGKDARAPSPGASLSRPDTPAQVLLQEVSRTYPPSGGRGGRAVQALTDVSLSVARGETVAVVGPSGCGKSTLLELVCGLQPADTGVVRSAPAVLMPQRDLLLGWLTAAENAGLALRVAGASRAEARSRAAALFAELGLESFQGARPHELSGGMRQRVAFLRTLLSGKPVLCLDEPFGALDAITRSEMQQWLAETLSREPRTVLLVTHDIEEAVLLGDRVLVLSPRPGRVLAELDVALPHPRRRLDAAVTALRERALAQLARTSAAALEVR